MSNILEVKNLCIRYLDSDTDVVHNFSFDLGEGEILCLRGKSGIGKSTVTAAIMGTLDICNAAATGEILYNNENLISCSEDVMRKIRWREIALVPQSSMNAFNPAYTIRKTLREMMKLENRKVTKQEMKLREERLMDVAHLDRAVLDCYAYEMSGGMKQRAAIALAMIYTPKLLILDEATTGLDLKVQADVLGTILQIKQETNMSILFISHDAQLGNQISDRKVELE